MVCIASVWGRLVLGEKHNWESQNFAYIAMHHLPGLLCEFMLGTLAWKAWKSWRLWLSWGASSGLQTAEDKGPQTPTLLSIVLLFAFGVGAWLALAQYFSNVGDEGVRAGVLKGQMGLLAAACFALMVLGSVLLHQRVLALKAPFLENWLGSKILKSLAMLAGKVSYGVYLLHIALLILVQQHANSWLNDSQIKWSAAGLTLLASWLLHELWEGPFRAWGRAMAQKIQRP